MTWWKAQCESRTNPKLVQAGPSAAWLWYAGNCWAREHLTDGKIPHAMMASMVPGLTERQTMKLAAVLVAVRLWHEVDGGFQIHDFLDHQQSKEKVLTDRRKDSDRHKKAPEDRIPNGITTESEVLYARTHNSPSVSPSGGISSLEGGMGETAEKPIISGQSTPKNWGKVHSDHVSGFCDWVCLPEFIFEEFRTKSPGAEYVRGWAQRVRQQWEGQTIGKDNLKFWRARWSDSHPEKGAPSASRPEHIERMLAIERGERKY